MTRARALPRTFRPEGRRALASRPCLSKAGSLLQCPASFLLSFDRFEQRLEIAEPEAPRAVALDDLEEDGRPVHDRLGEDLKQVAFFVAVGKDRVLAKLLDVDFVAQVAEAGAH